MFMSFGWTKITVACFGVLIDSWSNCMPLLSWKIPQLILQNWNDLEIKPPFRHTIPFTVFCCLKLHEHLLFMSFRYDYQYYPQSLSWVGVVYFNLSFSSTKKQAMTSVGEAAFDLLHWVRPSKPYDRACSAQDQITPRIGSVCNLN